MFGSRKSPNFDDRADGAYPGMIIIHYTDMESDAAALERLCDAQAKVSAHYLIEENGKLHQLVSDDKRAWHAGVAYWQGITDINSASIGIELVNPGHSNGYREFPDGQINSLVKLCKKLMKKYSIKAEDVLGHSDIAPARKQDPGHLFPWRDLAEQGIGIWAQPEEMDYQAAEDIILSTDSLHELLGAFGYDPAASFEEVLMAYHRHFYPEKFHEKSDPKQPDILTCARLLALIRTRHDG